MTTSRWRVAAAIVGLLAIAIASRAIDTRRVLGDIRGDEATYIAMAESLAHDFDIRYDARDLARFERVYPEGPNGIFLKRAYTRHLVVRASWPPIAIDKEPVPETESLAFGKAFIYPLVAAPFVALGGVGGMLTLNVILLGICVWCAVRFAQAQMGRWSGALMGVVFFGLSVVPVYVVWLTPEMFTVTLVCVGLFLWLYKYVAGHRAAAWWNRPGTDIAAAVLFGMATFSKPNHILFVGPLLVSLVMARRWRHLVIVGAMFAVSAGGLYATNAWLTGEANYQGSTTADGQPDPGGRRTFLPDNGKGYPFDGKGGAFERGGAETTNDTSSERTETRDIFTRLLLPNLEYFFIGRDAGLIPFFFPGVAIAALWLIRVRRSTLSQVMVALVIAASIGAFVIIAPYTWNGGGGPPGNRYFLSIYPAMLFLLPAGTGIGAAALASIVGAAFVGPMVLHPLAEKDAPWVTVERAPFTRLPVELTLVLDLPVRLYPPRGYIPFTPNPGTVPIFTYMDGNTYYAEGDGLWIAGPASTDIVVRTETPLTWVRLDLSGRVANHITATMGGRTTTVDLDANGRGAILLSPRVGQWYHQSYGYVLHLTTTAGFVPADVDGGTDHRRLGVFVRPTFSVTRQPPLIEK